MNVTADGKVPVGCAIPVIGKPTEVVVTVWVNGASSGTLTVAALVMVGAPPTVNVKLCVAFGVTPLVEVKVQVCGPASDTSGEPDSVPPPLASATKVTEGSAGVQPPNAAVGVGMPFEAKVKLLAWVGIKMALLALVICGARVLVMLTVAVAESRVPSFTLNVKLSLAVAFALGV